MVTETLPKRDAYKDVLSVLTEQVIEKLKKGIVPWRVSWVGAGIPESLISHNAYRGINRIVLAALGYERNIFVTARQLKTIGGTLIPEEWSHVVSYLDDGMKKELQANTGNVVPPEASGEKVPKKLDSYRVYNIAQCALPADFPVPPVQSEIQPLAHDIEIRRRDKIAYYNPLKDYVNIPKDSCFGTKEECSYMEFHQMIHATGHHSRLDRRDLIQMSEFGYDRFSHEELVAEIGASYLMSHFGMKENFAPTGEYLAGWIKKLENSKWLLFSAAQAAEKAINFLFIGELEREDMKID